MESAEIFQHTKNANKLRKMSYFVVSEMALVQSNIFSSLSWNLIIEVWPFIKQDRPEELFQFVTSP